MSWRASGTRRSIRQRCVGGCRWVSASRFIRAAGEQRSLATRVIRLARLPWRERLSRAPGDPASVARSKATFDSADPFDNPVMAMINGAHWDDPITETPHAGSIEIWRIINTTEDAHPIHVHLVQFQILDRRPFDPNRLPDLVYTGPAEAPAANERPAWKDTVISHPGTVTRFIARFDLPSAAPPRSGQSFRYVLHCHILEHEENEMMRPYLVLG
ncbi:MAG TPA: multicopper oxidase domain-containing protein [Burkholderiaceae bacterium]|nr:multicopper oxidase domain-containing protein [Burkholderiaceae bacterium]